MLITNIVLAVLVLGFIGAGMKDGFIETLGRIVGAVVGFIAARAWSLPVASFLGALVPLDWSRLIAFIFIFLVITRLIGYAFQLLDGAFRILSVLPFLKSINSLLGAVLGLVEGLILVGGVIYLVTTFKLVPWLSALFASSVVAAWILKTFNILLGVLL